jgi:hypothetical protein
MTEQPLFIIGSGRSGTTLLYNLLSCHPDVCWFSELTDAFPDIPVLPLSHGLMDMPMIGPFLKRRIVGNHNNPLGLTPAEGERIYHEACGFKHTQKTTSVRTNDRSAILFKKYVSNHLKWTGKQRFLSKQTANTQRLPVISSIYPQARYIHIVRDPRAVVNSLIHVHWWPTVSLWWNQGKTPLMMVDEGYQMAEVCSLHLKHNLHELLIFENKHREKVIRVSYESLTRQTHSTIRSILNFCQLPDDIEYLKILPHSFENMNSKWKRQLNRNQKRFIIETLRKEMARMGYSCSGDR